MASSDINRGDILLSITWKCDEFLEVQDCNQICHSYLIGRKAWRKFHKLDLSKYDQKKNMHITE